jgi:prepilin-type processing-associated H-X9-DG protein
MLLYANDYHGQYPDRVGLLLEGDDEDAVEGARIFVSPYSNDTPATGPTTHAVAAQMTAGGHVSYVYCGRGFAATASANTVLAYGPLTGWGRNVLFGDGHVERVAPARTNYLLSELAAGNNPPRALSSATAP